MRSFLHRVLLVALVLGVIVFAASFVYRMFIKPPVDAVVQEEQGTDVRESTVQLRIFNGTAVAGIGRQATDYLRLRGFDVVTAENLPTKEAQSYVVNLRGDSVSSHRVAYALGIDSSMIRIERDSALMLDCSVVLGDDYEKLRPFR